MNNGELLFTDFDNFMVFSSFFSVHWVFCEQFFQQTEKICVADSQPYLIPHGF